jgi:hypothetical protein
MQAGAFVDESAVDLRFITSREAPQGGVDAHDACVSFA